MVRRSKRNAPVVEQIVESDDESVATPSRAKKRKVLSDSSDDEDNVEFQAETKSQIKVSEAKPVKRSKIKRCLDSSDEENQDQNVENNLLQTPKADREKKLKAMSQRMRAKKGSYSSSSEEDDDHEGQSDSDSDLPMFENEEEPPEDAAADIDDPDADLEGFVVDDDTVEMEEKDDNDDEEDDDEEEEEEPIVKFKPNKKVTRKVKKKEELDDNEENEDSNSNESEDDYDYANPYQQMNEEMENEDIIKLLSKTTAKDKKNAKMYKKEMGKYQFSVRSSRNKAAQISKTARYQINMEKVKTDRGFKDERNLEVKDDEYYDYVETCLFGEQVRIFPHTKKSSKYNSKCAISRCGELFTAGESKIIGCTKFSEFNLQYLKRTTNFGKESFYYICLKHLPVDENESSDEYQSDIE